MPLVCLNGKFLPQDQPLFTASNRSFKWGDGIFETIRVSDGKILLQTLHFDRLFLSLRMLHITASYALDAQTLAENMLAVCRENGCTSSARVRLSVWRNESNEADYLIEAWPLAQAITNWNQEGWSIGIYPFARKSQDAFANLKSANYLTYVLADLYAKDQGLDEAIVLNALNHIADASKANIFLIKNSEIYTPSLSQGCINGVMRKFLIDQLKLRGFHVHQQELKETDLIGADEIFLTNALYGIRWVRSFLQYEYRHTRTLTLYKEFFQ
jgi:branched-chain amino acid aminotransferase